MLRRVPGVREDFDPSRSGARDFGEKSRGSIEASYSASKGNLAAPVAAIGRPHAALLKVH